MTRRVPRSRPSPASSPPTAASSVTFSCGDLDVADRLGDATGRSSGSSKDGRAPTVRQPDGDLELGAVIEGRRSASAVARGLDGHAPDGADDRSRPDLNAGTGRLTLGGARAVERRPHRQRGIALARPARRRDDGHPGRHGQRRIERRLAAGRADRPAGSRSTPARSSICAPDGPRAPTRRPATTRSRRTTSTGPASSRPTTAGRRRTTRPRRRSGSTLDVTANAGSLSFNPSEPCAAAGPIAPVSGARSPRQRRRRRPGPRPAAGDRRRPAPRGRASAASSPGSSCSCAASPATGRRPGSATRRRRGSRRSAVGEAARQRRRRAGGADARLAAPERAVRLLPRDDRRPTTTAIARRVPRGAGGRLPDPRRDRRRSGSSRAAPGSTSPIRFSERDGHRSASEPPGLRTCGRARRSARAGRSGRPDRGAAVGPAGGRRHAPTTAARSLSACRLPSVGIGGGRAGATARRGSSPATSSRSSGGRCRSTSSPTRPAADMRSRPASAPRRPGDRRRPRRGARGRHRSSRPGRGLGQRGDPGLRDRPAGDASRSSTRPRRRPGRSPTRRRRRGSSGRSTIAPDALVLAASAEVPLLVVARRRRRPRPAATGRRSSSGCSGRSLAIGSAMVLAIDARRRRSARDAGRARRAVRGRRPRRRRRLHRARDVQRRRRAATADRQGVGEHRRRAQAAATTSCRTSSRPSAA